MRAQRFRPNGFPWDLGTARDLFALVGRDRGRVLATAGSTVMAARLFELLPARPTAAKAVAALVDAGVLQEMSGKRRARSFGYRGYLDVLKVGTGLEG